MERKIVSHQQQANKEALALAFSELMGAKVISKSAFDKVNEENQKFSSRIRMLKS